MSSIQKAEAFVRHDGWDHLKMRLQRKLHGDV